MKPLGAIAKLICIAAITLFLTPMLAISNVLRVHWSRAIVRFWHGCVCRILNICVVVEGDAIHPRAAGFVSNHYSYLDILVIGSVIEANFVAKEEVKKWPMIGRLAQMAGTIFIKRRRVEAKRHTSIMGKMLDKKHKMIFFPEGTSGNGQPILKFKSSLFQPFLDRGNTLVQPVSLSYFDATMGRVLDLEAIKRVAWMPDQRKDDSDFLSHFWAFLVSCNIVAVIKILPAISVNSFENRKSIARLLCQQVSTGHAQVSAGQLVRNHPAGRAFIGLRYK